MVLTASRPTDCPACARCPLQQIVDRVRRLLEVLHDVANALPDRFRNMIDIGLRHRPNYRVVGGEIGLEDGPVDRLGRIVVGIGARRAARSRGAAAAPERMTMAAAAAVRVTIGRICRRPALPRASSTVACSIDPNALMPVSPTRWPLRRPFASQPGRV